ncbi:MAG: dihydropteroate synthase [Neisseriaceae bacterium]|nr:dihydropteroate synthase [Neisseriaceae bacterium]
MLWQAGRFKIQLDTPKIMGIVNLTPDSFSDGGTYSNNTTNALNYAEKLLKDGADILDIGGESTRPNAKAITQEQEWQRIKEVLREIVNWNIPISLDTRHTKTMQLALKENLIDIVNDVNALGDKGAVELLSQNPDTGICLMHMQGLPENMQNNPNYQDVCLEVKKFLVSRINACLQQNIDRNRLLLDPGIGFGKTVEHNLALLKNPNDWLPSSYYPYLIGISRKTVLGEIINEKNPTQRITASVTAAIESIRRGANIVRVHDVKETKQALLVYQAYNS